MRVLCLALNFFRFFFFFIQRTKICSQIQIQHKQINKGRNLNFNRCGAAQVCMWKGAVQHVEQERTKLHTLCTFKTFVYFFFVS